MAKAAAVPGTKPNIFNRVTDFFLDVKVEMEKVTWPSMEELKASTSVVLFLLCVSSAIIYVFDIVFQFLVIHALSLAAS